MSERRLEEFETNVEDTHKKLCEAMDRSWSVDADGMEEHDCPMNSTETREFLAETFPRSHTDGLIVEYDGRYTGDGAHIAHGGEGKPNRIVVHTEMDPKEAEMNEALTTPEAIKHHLKHEVGHNVWDKCLTSDQRSEWNRRALEEYQMGEREETGKKLLDEQVSEGRDLREAVNLASFQKPELLDHINRAAAIEAIKRHDGNTVEAAQENLCVDAAIKEVQSKVLDEDFANAYRKRINADLSEDDWRSEFMDSYVFHD